MPPATTTSVSSAAMPWAASITDFRPEPQTLLIVSAATFGGSPAWIAAWRAGAWPSPAETTLPMMTSSTPSGETPARAIASLTTMPRSWGAVNPLSDPRNFPVGTRTAERMTASRIVRLLAIREVTGGGLEETGAQVGVGDDLGARDERGRGWNPAGRGRA